MDEGKQQQPSERPYSKSSRPTFNRHLSSGAEKRNREILSIVRQMSARNLLDGEAGDESMRSTYSEEEDDDDEDENTEEKIRAPQLNKDYDPTDFENMPAPAEIRELFLFVAKYSPQIIELDYKLMPFVPDFKPAVGDIDAFVKLTRPDRVASDLGLKVLDEPCTKQSDPAVLHLQLRATTKEISAKREVVKKIENAAKHHKAIDSWVKDLSELHKSKHSSLFGYSNAMPNIDTLMQEWPTDFEERLANVQSPLNRSLDCNLLTLVDIVCAMVDVPVHESRIESLHLLFSLYSTVKKIQMKADPATTNFRRETTLTG